ncbi:hypothetical protein SSTU70S_01069 [Stutzerimonas stutzeri]
MALQLRQLNAVVGALHLHCVQRLLGGHAQTVRDRHRDHVGQVVLALCIAVGQAAQPFTDPRARYGEDAGIAFADRPLRGAGILVLDDGLHLALHVAHDAAVTGRIGKLDGEQRELVGADLVQQALQGIGFDQRYVAIEDQHPLGRQVRQRLRHRVAGTELLGLYDIA